MKKIITLLVALFVVASVSNSAEQRVLLENYTGAWCGWCPRGTYVMDQLEKANPGKIIGIKFHSGDGMALAQGDTMYAAFGQGGFPSGSINRIPWKDQNGNTVINLGTNNWEYCTGQVLPTTAPVEVTLNWKFNEATQKISGTISCNVLVDNPNQLAFQVIVCENNVTGSGSGFDQNNALSNNPDYKDTPYFSLPSPIVGFVHNKVARKIIGGCAGNLGNFTSSVKAGEKYTWNFISDVPSVPSGTPVKMQDVFLVGVVGVSQQGFVIPVLNCVESAGGGSSNTLTCDGDPVSYIGSGAQSTFKFTLENGTSEDKTYNLSLVKDDKSPEGWLAQIVGGKKSIAVKAGAKASLSVDVFPGANVGNGNYSLIATDAADAENKLDSKIEVVHTGAERLYIHSQLDDYDGLTNLLPQTEYNDFATISISKIGSDLTKIQTVLAKFNKVKTAIISTGDDMAFSASDITLLQYYNTAGVDILVDGTIGLLNKDIQTYLKSTFGFSAIKQFKKINSEQEQPLSGIKDDPITDGFVSSITPDKYWPSLFSITDAAKATKIMAYSDSVKSVAGIRCNNNEVKFIALGFSIGNMLDDLQKIDLLKKSIYWLENVVETAPVIAVDKSDIDFATVTVNQTAEQNVTIRNTGTANLVIEGANITGTDPTAFAFEGLSSTVTLTPNENLVVKVKFTPTEDKSYSAKLNILSNDTKNSEVPINLTGTGTSTTVENQSGFISNITLSPNPVNDNTKITYKVNGVVNAVVRIIDAQGKVVSEICNGTLNEGTYNYSLNNNNLSSGSYFISAQFDGKYETIPFVVVK